MRRGGGESSRQNNGLCALPLVLYDVVVENWKAESRSTFDMTLICSPLTQRREKLDTKPRKINACAAVQAQRQNKQKEKKSRKKIQ